MRWRAQGPDYEGRGQGFELEAKWRGTGPKEVLLVWTKVATGDGEKRLDLREGVPELLVNWVGKGDNVRNQCPALNSECPWRERGAQSVSLYYARSLEWDASPPRVGRDLGVRQPWATSQLPLLPASWLSRSRAASLGLASLLLKDLDTVPAVWSTWWEEEHCGSRSTTLIPV